MEYKIKIGQEFLQNCGDTLIVLEETKIRKSGHICYKCRFKKYIYEVIETGNHIKLGKVNNPQIEQVEFIDKIWPQKCGYNLKIIKKSNLKNNNTYLWECEFVEYPYKKLYVKKKNILDGNVKY